MKQNRPEISSLEATWHTVWGIETSNPEITGNDIELKDLQSALPLALTIRYDNEVRNEVVNWMKAKGYGFTTYLAQPMLKLQNTRVIIRRVVK